MKKKKRKKYDGMDIFSFVALTLLAMSIVIPFWNAVVISFETSSAYLNKPFSWLPGEFTLANYQELMRQGEGLVRAYMNTIKVTVIGVAAGMSIMVMSAYAFSREFPGKKGLFMVMLFTMYFGGGLVPTYLLIKNLGLIDTHAGVILLGLSSTYNIIVMRNGFQSIPVELSEAAVIDGASDPAIFFKVMLPLQKPMIATFTLFTAVGCWNNWYWPMLILNSRSKVLLQIFLRSLINATSALTQQEMIESADAIRSYSLGIQMAAVFMVVLPIMLVYPFLQKHFAKGMLVGGVKM